MQLKDIFSLRKEKEELLRSIIYANQKITTLEAQLCIINDKIKEYNNSLIEVHKSLDDDLEKAIFEMYYIEIPHKTLVEISDELNYTYDYIKEVHKRIKDKINKNLDKYNKN
jgi:chromosome segregation ATPase